MRACLILMCFVACLGGCAAVPGASDGGPPRAAYPPILPLGPLLAQSDAMTSQDAETAGPALAARGADLRRRAAMLRDRPIWRWTGLPPFRPK